MIIILGALFLTLFIGIKYRKRDNIDSYLDRDHTLSIIGIFAVIIFVSHFSGYLDQTPLNKLDVLGFTITSSVGQLMVAPFMFFSGYGIYEQIKKKGDKYVNTIPKGRMLKVWLMFLMTWVLFFVLSFFTHPEFDFKRYILSVFAIEHIGNSNWYVAVIIALYFSSFLSFKLIGNKRDALIVNIILCILLIFILQKNTQLGGCWWDTIPSYAFGLFYSYHKEKIVKLYYKFKASRWILFVISLLLTVAFGVLNAIFNNLNYYFLMEISFCMIFACFLSLFVVKNKIVVTLGKYCFWIYALQRISMKIFYYVTPIRNILYVYFLVCVLVTAALAFGIDKLFVLLWKPISKPRK